MGKTVDLVNQGRAGDPANVLEAIHAVMHLYRAQQYRVLRDAPHAVTHMEVRVLDFFARHPDATQTDLVAHSGRDKGQLARLITGLRERGWLEARPDEADRRSLRLRVTAAGQAADLALRRQGKRLAGIAVQGFSEAEKAQLAALLERIRANLEDAG